MRIAYYNPLINEPLGCGTHGRGLHDGWVRAGHEVLVIPEIAGRDGETVSRVGRYAGYPELVKVPMRDVRGRIQAARGTAAVAARIRRFGAEVLVTRRHAYDYLLDRLVSESPIPVVAEVNAIAHLEARHWGELALPWEERREREYIARARRVVCVTQEVAEQVRRLGVDPTGLVVTRNGADTDLFSPEVAPDPAVGAWAAGHSFVVGYCGKGAGLHDIATICAGVEAILAQAPRAGFLFVGPTIQELRQEGLRPESEAAVLACGPAPHSSIPSKLVCASVLWAAFKDIYGSPLKQYEYMAMGRPLAMAMGGTPAADVEAAGCGIVVSRGDAAGLAAAVLRLARDRDGADEMGRAGRRWVIGNASWTAIADAMVAGLTG
jgi:glycosyltransferase involved in cell wall biosynthesis